MKSYEQVTEQLTRIMYAELETKHLEEETYVHLSWEDWAYIVIDYPYNHLKVVACGEEGYTVIRSGITQPHEKFYCVSAFTGKRLFYDDREECWYSAYLKAEQN